jgi:hypothetical protein
MQRSAKSFREDSKQAAANFKLGHSESNGSAPLTLRQYHTAAPSYRRAGQAPVAAHNNCFAREPFTGPQLLTAAAR